MISTCKENIVEIVYMFWTEHVTFKERRRSEKGKEDAARKERKRRKERGKERENVLRDLIFFFSFFFLL